MSSLGASHALPTPTISVRCTSSGIALTVEGDVDRRGGELLAEVVRAALVAVGRARRIQVDLTRAGMATGVPRVLRQLERAGATIRSPAAAPAPTPVRTPSAPAGSR
jgi:hypothetical protein